MLNRLEARPTSAGGAAWHAPIPRAVDSGVDVVAWLPDGAGCGTEKAYALQVKTFNAAGSDPEVHSYLFLVLVAAIYLDRSSLGTAGAWSMRREPSASDVAAVRTAAGWPPTAKRAVPAAGMLEAGELREPERPGPGPDPLQASTPAEFTAALAQFRVQAGMPASPGRCPAGLRPGASSSTLLAVVHDGERLPSLRTVSAFVTGCGGSAEDLSQAHRRVAPPPRRVRWSGSPGIPGSGQVDGDPPLRVLASPLTPGRLVAAAAMTAQLPPCRRLFFFFFFFLSLPAPRT